MASVDIAWSRLCKRGPKRQCDFAKPESICSQKRKQEKYSLSFSLGQRTQKPVDKITKKPSWDKECWNLDCDAIHPVIDCANTPDESKKELMDKCHSEMKKDKLVHVKSVSSTEDGRGCRRF